MRARPILELDDAKRIAGAAIANAVLNGWAISVAIVDDGGHVIYLERLDGAQKASATIAIEKAKCAILYQRPTKAFEESLAGGRHAVLALPNVIPMEGGIPITVDGALVGAIGVSGVQSFQDGIVAKAGLDAFN